MMNRFILFMVFLLSSVSFWGQVNIVKSPMKPKTAVSSSVKKGERKVHASKASVQEPFFFKELKKLANKGDASAMFLVGEYLENNVGLGDALLWWKKAALKNHPMAQYKYGCWCTRGCYINDDGKRVWESCNQKNFELGLGWIQKAANQNLPEAQEQIADIYEFGTGVEQDDEKAIFWIKKAAEQNLSSAMFKYGSVIIDTDSVKAVEWITKAATKGYAEAQTFLGACYMRGYKVEQDMKKGFMWTRDAALQGNVDAEYNLAVFYYNGMGCEKNIAEAAYWAGKAAQDGNEYAEKTLKEWFSEK